MFLSNKLFTTSLYFLQFLRWYHDYMQNNSLQTKDVLLILIKSLKQKNNNKIPNNLENENELDENILPPPELPEKLLNNKHYKILLENSSLCPLCSKERTNQCVLSVSGFVFCYPCIFKFLKEHKRCPITSFPCSTKNIVRIYGTSN